MRINVQKVMVLGPNSKKRLFFKRAQELGIAEFIGTHPEGVDKPADIQNYMDALHILRAMVPVEQAAQTDYHSAHILARNTNEHQETIEHLLEKKRILEKEISRVEPFGDFSTYDLSSLQKQSGRIFQFFFSKGFKSHDELIHLNTFVGLEYYLSIATERRAYDGFIEIIIDKSAPELREELAEIEKNIDHLEIELSSMAHHKSLLQKGLINALNRYHLSEAIDKVDTYIEDKAFAVEAWVPKNKRTLLEGLTLELDLLLEPIQIEKSDKRPTFLENKGLARLGEDLVGIYDTPGSKDRDPSLWVFIFFGIFFSMIVADAGYGMLICLISIYIYHKYGKKKEGAMRRFSKLCLALSIGCIFWGIMLTSFFGVPVSPNNPMRKVSIIHYVVQQKAEYLMSKKGAAYNEIIKEYPKLADAKTPMEFLTTIKKQTDTGEKYIIYDKFSDNILIELAIFVGFIHICLSFIRYLDRAWAGLGWVIFMIGGYLFFPQMIDATSFIYFVFKIPQVGTPIIGLYMIYSGIALAVILAIVQNRLGGLGEIQLVIQVFSDVMSYLRIYALSLAGMIMATTFDHIGTTVPFYIGIFILIAGHTINFVLALMGGVIHGLRLNFIEWYHYSFVGGGRKFRPLSLLQID